MNNKWIVGLACLSSLTLAGCQGAQDKFDAFKNGLKGDSAEAAPETAQATPAPAAYGAYPGAYYPTAPNAVPLTAALSVEQSGNAYAPGYGNVVPQSLQAPQGAAAYQNPAYPYPDQQPRFARQAGAVNGAPQALPASAAVAGLQPGQMQAIPQQMTPMPVQTSALQTVDMPAGGLPAAPTAVAEVPIPGSIPAVPVPAGRELSLPEFAQAQVASLKGFPYADPRQRSTIASAMRGQRLPKVMRFIPSDLQANVLRDFGWDAVNPADGFKDSMVIGAQIGTPVVSPVNGTISKITFADDKSSISVRAHGLEFEFSNLEVGGHLRVGQPISTDVILGTVSKSGQFEHAIHFVAANQLSAANQANAIHPYYVAAFML